MQILTGISLHLGLHLEGLATEYTVGDNVSINCLTDLKVQRIVLLDAFMSEIANSESASLTLNLPSVTEAMDGMRFTCRVESDFGGQDMEFIISVTTGSGGGGSGAVAGAVVGAILGVLLLVAVIVLGVLLCIR